MTADQATATVTRTWTGAARLRNAREHRALEHLWWWANTVRNALCEQAQTARTCICGHLEECNAQRPSTSSLRRRLRLTLDDPVRPPHHPTDNPVVSVQWACSVLR